MALLQLQPNFTDNFLPSVSYSNRTPTKPRSILFGLKQQEYNQLKKKKKCVRLNVRLNAAIAEQISQDQDSVIQEEQASEQVVKYDWTEEWYPLYLTKNVPDDAPLGLTVFDKQVVLYKDGHGQLRCHQDRCPHRFAFASPFFTLFLRKDHFFLPILSIHKVFEDSVDYVLNYITSVPDQRVNNVEDYYNLYSG